MRINRLIVMGVLLAATFFFSVRGYENLENAQRGRRVKPLQLSAGNPAENVPPLAWQTAPESAYTAVVEMNLFSPDRKPPAEPEEAGPETEVKQAQVAGGKIELHGVIKMPGYETALINNPNRKTGEDKESLWVKPGDRVGELQVAEILSDSIVFQEGSKRIRIVLYDAKKTVAREEIKTEARPTVVTTEPKKEPEKSKATETQESPKPSPVEAPKRINPFVNQPRNSNQQ